VALSVPVASAIAITFATIVPVGSVIILFLKADATISLLSC
jgi:hypothetical protein